ncbi:DUF4870 family protein [Ponticaulis profundi]|uniref:DUF4870 family protein n=1 Tax=Ponticaulis profundi TaxID=2665222 RepID=A0ABW1S5E5_9PROT
MSDTQISTTGGQPGNANLVYILYLVGAFIGLAGLVGVIMAYVGKDDADELTKSHYINQIHIFWKGFAYLIAGVILSVVLIGFLVILFWFVWHIVRTVKGMNELSKGNPYPIELARSWLF